MPALEPKQGIVVEAEADGQALAGNGLVEHTTESRAIDGDRLHPKADDPARRLIHDHEDPVRFEQSNPAAGAIAGAWEGDGDVLAMAHHQWNHADEAWAALGQAVEFTQTRLPHLESGDLGQRWNDWVIAHLLLREAKALMDGEASATQQAKP